VFLAHLLIDGSRVANGQELVGLALNVGLADLAMVGAHAYVLGHIHLPQQWDIAGAPCFYTGSPFAKTWGETEQKSVTLLTWNGTGFDVERIPTPSAPLIHLEASWNGAGIELDNGGGLADWAVGGAEVRVRYSVPSDQREPARLAAERLRDELLNTWGAVSVKLEPVVSVEQRARVPEVATARTLADQLQAYWGSVGFEPGDRRDLLLSKLSQLEVGP
jgi:DNA repair exonuclease SbcCD nuclease subunit